MANRFDIVRNEFGRVNVSSMLLRPVSLGVAVAATAVYLVLALGVAMLATERAEIA